MRACAWHTSERSATQQYLKGRRVSGAEHRRVPRIILPNQQDFPHGAGASSPPNAPSPAQPAERVTPRAAGSAQRCTRAASETRAALALRILIV